MKQINDTHKSDILNKTDMTKDQYINITDQAQGTGEHLSFISTYLTQMNAHITSRFTSIDNRFIGVENRLTGVESRLTGVESHSAGLEVKIDGLRAEMNQRFTESAKNIDGLRDDIRQNSKDIREEVRHSLWVTMIFMVAVLMIMGTVLTLVMSKSII